jgi:hypothetical protein
MLTAWTGSRADTDSLTADDKLIKFNFLTPDANPLPLAVGSNLSTQYTADQFDDVLQLGRMNMEEGVKFPAVFSGIAAGSTLGETVFSSVRDGTTPVGTDNRLYVTNWLNKQWAGVNLCLAHTHEIERPEEDLTYGLSKSFNPLNKNLSVTVGEYVFTEMGAHYSYRTADLSIAYGWKRWGLCVYAEDYRDTYTRGQLVGAQIKNSF